MREMTIDHILPVSRGGGHEPENLCAACRKCNEAKGGRTVAEWRAGIAKRYCVGRPLRDDEIARMATVQRQLNLERRAR